MSLFFFFVCAPTQKNYRDIRHNAFKLSVGEAYIMYLMHSSSVYIHYTY